jgi:hypothetical protein
MFVMRCDGRDGVVEKVEKVEVECDKFFGACILRKAGAGGSTKGLSSKKSTAESEKDMANLSFERRLFLSCRTMCYFYTITLQSNIHTKYI